MVFITIRPAIVHELKISAFVVIIIVSICYGLWPLSFVGFYQKLVGLYYF